MTPKVNALIQEKQQLQEKLLQLEEQRDSLYEQYQKDLDYAAANKFLVLLKEIKTLTMDIILLHKEEIESYSFDNDSVDKMQHEAKVNSIELDGIITEWEKNDISNDIDNLKVYLNYKNQKILVSEKLSTFIAHNDPNAGKQLIPMLIELIKVDIDIVSINIDTNSNKISKLKTTIKDIKDKADTDRKKSTIKFLIEKTCLSLKPLLKRKRHMQKRLELLNVNITSLQGMKSSFEDRTKNKFERRQDTKSLVLLSIDALEQTNIDNIVDNFKEYKYNFIY